MMEKRKRSQTQQEEAFSRKTAKQDVADLVTLQVVIGDYAGSIHGFVANISKEDPSEQEKAPSVQFADTFLFRAHNSSLRCLALSPLAERHDEGHLPETITLASGSADTRINLYSLSTTALRPDQNQMSLMPTLAGNDILEDTRNREIGSLFHHSSTITALSFPNKSKLLASADDNTISVMRTKDLAVVSTIKAPRPKVQGRPSGDTAALGAAPVGVNDFAVHPSMKLMLSVGKGEKAMRLWNLVRGNKAGALNFRRDWLEEVKEGKYSTGEGRTIVWNNAGEELAVAFERGILVFGIDCNPRCKILPAPLTKLHSIQYVTLGSIELLAVSTEDGRVILYSTHSSHLVNSEAPTNGIAKGPLPAALPVCQIDNKAANKPGRVKAFEVLRLPNSRTWRDSSIMVTCGSDGSVNLWHLKDGDIVLPETSHIKTDTQDTLSNIGEHIGTYQTSGRITCMVAYVMLKHPEDEDMIDEADSVGEDESDTTDDSDGEHSGDDDNSDYSEN